MILIIKSSILVSTRIMAALLVERKKDLRFLIVSHSKTHIRGVSIPIETLV